MTRDRRIRWGAIPLHDDGREMLGTHGSVTTNDGRRVLTHVVYGEYVSRANFVRYAVNPYGTPGVRYRIMRGGFGSTATDAGTVVATGGGWK